MTGQRAADLSENVIKLAADLAPTIGPEDRRQLAMSRRDEIFRHLKGSRFASVWTSISSATAA